MAGAPPLRDRERAISTARRSAFDTYSTALAAWAVIEYLVPVRGTVIGPPLAFVQVAGES
jgi:hypothetical protein